MILGFLGAGKFPLGTGSQRLERLIFPPFIIIAPGCRRHSC